ncbi:MAG: preprotein translocase subunit SecG [Planctomycetes bacterium]|nr:preprotein translocase subunit SecG [Planctomycetota bacterium]
MTVLPLLAVGLLMKFVAVLFVLVSLVLILVVLMQKGRGGGLSGAFGGGMASGLLGSKTGDFLTWVTIVLVTVFLFLAVLMARYYRPSTTYGRGAPATAQQPVTGGPTTAPQAPASEQPAPTAPSATPPAGATQPATPPSAPAAQPPAPQPAPSDTGAQPTPSADTGKSGG